MLLSRPSSPRKAIGTNVDNTRQAWPPNMAHWNRALPTVYFAKSVEGRLANWSLEVICLMRLHTCMGDREALRSGCLFDETTLIPSAAYLHVDCVFARRLNVENMGTFSLMVEKYLCRTSVSSSVLAAYLETLKLLPPCVPKKSSTGGNDSPHPSTSPAHLSSAAPPPSA